MPYDPHRKKVVSLLHFDGANNSTSFPDDTGKIWTANGTAKIVTAQSVYGGSSLRVDGTSGCRIYSSHADYVLGTDDFSIQMRLYPVSGGGGATYARLLQIGSNSTPGSLIVLRDGGNPNPLKLSVVGYFGGAYSGFVTSISAIPNNAWADIEISRESGTWRLFQDGALQQSAVSGSGANNLNQNVISLGGNNANGENFNGYIDEFRLTKRLARHTATFTPDAAPYSLVGRPVSGVVQAGDPPAPVSRKVVIVDAASKLVVGSGVSSAVDGSYSISSDADGAVYGYVYIDYGVEWKPSTAVVLATRCITTANNGHWYEVETSGTTGATEPTWPTNGSTVSDGTVTWRDKGVMERPWAEGPYVPPIP